MTLFFVPDPESSTELIPDITLPTGVVELGLNLGESVTDIEGAGLAETGSGRDGVADS